MSVVPSIRALLRSLDPDLPLTNVTTMEQRFSDTLAPWRFALFLIGSFSTIAFVLATVGVYGIMAYTVSIRTHEIGIRMALGADRSRVSKLVIAEGMLLLVAGIALGLTGALAFNRVLSSMVYQISTTDLTTYAGVTLTWLLITFVAC